MSRIYHPIRSNPPQAAIGPNSQGRNYGKENPFEGTEYEEMWLNNPYRNTFMDYTWWDNLGLSNKAKDYNAEQQRLYNEYIAGIYELQMQNEYNSEAASAARMRSAGQNPDLLGLNNASDSDSMSPPNAGPSPVLNGQSPAISSLQMLGSVMSFALNAYQGISSTLNTLDAQNISNIKELADAARPYVTQSFAEAFLNKSDWESIVLNNSKSFSRRYNRRMRPIAENVFKHMLHSGDYNLQKSAYGNVSSTYDAQIGFEARDYFRNNVSMNSVETFISEMVKLGVEEYKLSRKRNISLANKERMLSDFRARSLETMLESYKKSGKHDILSGLILAGMLESNGVSLLGNPLSYGLVGGQRAVDDVVGGVSSSVKKVKDYLGL